MRVLSIAVVCIVFLCMTLPVMAQMYPRGYIGLFADEDRTQWCATGEPMYPVEVWVLCAPSYLGQICVEFGIRYPSNVTRSTATFNAPLLSPLYNLYCEDDICYMSVCYVACQWDWHWIFHQSLYVMNSDKTYLEIIPHPYAGAYHFANCEPGYPIEPCTKLANLYINYTESEPECIGMAADNASWGSIKSLFQQ
jgi:hypothetical protein